MVGQRKRHARCATRTCFDEWGFGFSRLRKAEAARGCLRTGQGCFAQDRVGSVQRWQWLWEVGSRDPSGAVKRLPAQHDEDRCHNRPQPRPWPTGPIACDGCARADFLQDRRRRRRLEIEAGPDSRRRSSSVSVVRSLPASEQMTKGGWRKGKPPETRKC